MSLSTDKPAEPGKVSAEIPMKLTDSENERRCCLIDQDVDGMLTSDEGRELDALQKQMLAYRHEVAPLELPGAIRDINGKRINQLVDDTQTAVEVILGCVDTVMERGIVIKLFWFTFTIKLGPEPKDAE